LLDSDRQSRLQLLTYRFCSISSIDDGRQQECVVGTSHDEPGIRVLAGKLLDKIQSSTSSQLEEFLSLGKTDCRPPKPTESRRPSTDTFRAAAETRSKASSIRGLSYSPGMPILSSQHTGQVDCEVVLHSLRGQVPTSNQQYINARDCCNRATLSVAIKRCSELTHSTSSNALTVSIIHITVVNSLQTGLAYFAGTGAYRSIGIVPVADRSPIGANLAYRTTF